jgi:hypothetical protein
VKLEVRRASDDDLGPLVAAFGSRHFFGDCLARQGGGDGVLLVAWLDGRPVGDVFLARHPAEEPRSAAGFRASPGSSTWRWPASSSGAASAPP